MRQSYNGQKIASSKNTINTDIGIYQQMGLVTERESNRTRNPGLKQPTKSSLSRGPPTNRTLRQSYLTITSAQSTTTRDYRKFNVR